MSAARSSIRVQWTLAHDAITLSAAASVAWELVQQEVREDATILSRSLGRTIQVRSSRGLLLAVVDGRAS